MKTKATLGALAIAITKEKIDAVVGPDHPYLFLGPDILLSKDGTLAGLFVLHIAEAHNPNDVLVRMSLARVAYPDNFQTILIIPPTSALCGNKTFISWMKTHFHSVVEWHSNAALGRYIHKSFDQPNQVKTLQSIRKSIFSQAEIHFAASLEELSLPKEKTTKSAKNVLNSRMITDGSHINPWSNPLALTPKTSRSAKRIRRLHTFRVADASLQRSSEVQPRLTRFGRLVFEMDNGLEEGLPVRQSQSKNALLVDKLPTHRFDPEKWLRSSAFAGFSLLRADDPDRIENKLDILSSKLNKAP